MATIFNVKRRFESIVIKDIAIDSIDDTKTAIADFNAEQMFTGKRADGSEITPTYSDTTIQIKQDKGQPSDRVTLRNTGSFYAGIRVNVSNEDISIYSTDSKADKLNKKYSTSKGNIFGLNTQYKGEYTRNNLQPVWKEKIENITFLKMN